MDGIPFLNLPLDHFGASWGSFRGQDHFRSGIISGLGIISGPGSFQGRDHSGAGDHFRAGDHFGAGIISGPVGDHFGAGDHFGVGIISGPLQISHTQGKESTAGRFTSTIICCNILHSHFSLLYSANSYLCTSCSVSPTSTSNKAETCILNVHVHQWGIMQCCKYPLECKISVHYKSSLKSSEKMHVSTAHEVEVYSKSKEYQLFIPQTKWSYCVTRLSSNCFRQMLINLQRQRFLDGIRRFQCRCGYQLNRTDPKGKSEKIYIGFGSAFK